MFEPHQIVRIKSWTTHNMSGDTKYGFVVRMMAGDEFVILNVGDDLDIRVRSEDVIV